MAMNRRKLRRIWRRHGKDIIQFTIFSVFMLWCFLSYMEVFLHNLDFNSNYTYNPLNLFEIFTRLVDNTRI